MKATNNIKIASLFGAAAMLMTPALSVAEVAQTTTGETGHSIVHRVSHSLAESKSYTRSTDAGYKWGKTEQRAESSSEWTTTESARGGYKWGQANEAAKPAANSYADTSTYEWGTRSFSEQSAYKWGMRSFSDQSAYKWGMRSFSDQSAYKWGMRSFSGQSAYKWGMR